MLRHYLEQGMSKAAIARHLGISRRTVYNWIEAGELDRDADSRAVRYGPRPWRASKLDPYKGIIDARLAAYPKLSAVRLFDEVQAAGYPGGYGQVKRYVRLPAGSLPLLAASCAGSLGRTSHPTTPASRAHPRGGAPPPHWRRPPGRAGRIGQIQTGQTFRRFPKS